jgi:hypothetical protein
MFRTRARRENGSRPTALRGSVGSARVWDEARRERGGAPEATPEARPGTQARAQPGSDAGPAAVAPDELRALVHGIVRVTLDTRLTDCTPARRVELTHELERRLLALFGLAAPVEPHAPPTPALGPEPGTAPAALDTAHDTAQRASPSATPTSGDHAPLTPAARTLALVLEDRLARLGGLIAQRNDLRHRLIELALAGHARPAPVAGPDTSQDATLDELRGLDVLQRRLAKLEHSLQETRATLAYVSGLEHVDTGLASLYRQVQGLAESDPRRELKRSVLDSIFHANLSLQKPAS